MQEQESANFDGPGDTMLDDNFIIQIEQPPQFSGVTIEPSAQVRIHQPYGSEMPNDGAYRITMLQVQDGGL